ncbi:MAG: peptidase [Actinomycetota bacterium]|nr:peptidase [Actinomycetota bacterium]
MLTGYMWFKTGKTLRVRFLDGDPAVQARIPRFAEAWSQYANITFQFGNDPDAEIRISFQDPGSWSWIGTQCLSIAKDQPTMNFGWLTPDTADDEYSRVVTHEFGHSIGCIHEHQNPVAGIPWDKPVVYQYYEGPPNNWTQLEVDVNLFQRYDKTITQYSTFDPTSIMEYPIPAQFTDGELVVGLNEVLSDMDKQFIAGQYPLQPKPDGEIEVGGAPAEGSIGVHGEEDTYHFTASAQGAYTIETSGPTDIVLALFGPGDSTALVASDDDSGVDLNAKIVQPLEPGEYEVRIRHWSPSGTGTYQVSVSMAG